MNTLKITDAQRQTFEQDGVLCLRNVISPAEVELLRETLRLQHEGLGNSATGYDLESFGQQVWQGANRIKTGAADRFDMDVFAEAIRADATARPLVETNEKSEGMFLYEAAGWKHHRGVREVAFDSALPPLVADLMNTATLHFWEDTTFVKAPHTKQKTAFHQDLAYFQISGEQCVIAWMPLDPANEANGVTRYVRGSHKWGKVFAPNLFVSQTAIPGATDPRCPDIEAHEDEYDIVSFDVNPGDVIIHHVLTVHGAGGNTTDKPRRAMSFRYCGDDVRYLDRPGAIPQPFIEEPLKTGDKLQSRDYPMVWPKPWPEAKLADYYDFEFKNRSQSVSLAAA